MIRNAPRSRRVRSARHGQRGIALIEALVSLLIFAFGVLGLLGLEARAISSAADSEDRNRAALLANEIASTLWVNGNVTVTAAQLAAWNVTAANNAAQGLPGGAVTVLPVSGSTNSVDVTITWKAPTRASADVNSKLVTRVILP
jgi:type IV pilus assembly protein PilV